MFRPMIKWEHWPVRFGDDLVQIGGVVPGIAQCIADPDGWVWALLSTLDGSRTVDQVVFDLVHRFPDRTAEDVRSDVVADLAQLVEEGYIEDAAAAPPAELTAAERERYSRGRRLWRWMDRSARLSSWDVQLLLKQARVVVVGLGGVGTTAALSLVLSGVGDVHCVEPDVVELSNLNRQILYTEADVGRPKVDVAVQRLREHNSSVTITGEPLTVTGPEVLLRLAAQCDVLVLAADRPNEIRVWANQVCVRTGTAWVHGGYHGPRASAGVYRPGTGPCRECLYTTARERRAGLPQRTPAPNPWGDTGQAAGSSTAGIAGHFVAHATMSLITGVPGLPVNREYALNLVNFVPEHRGVLEARADCPACGGQARPA